MQVARLDVANFRGIRYASLQLQRHTVFVGPNNAGKTTLIEALALLFGRDRLVRELTEHDFFGGDPGPADRIHLVATLVGFAGDDPGGHPSWFREDRAVPKWYDESTGQVHALRRNPAWRLACQIAYAARFDAPSLEVEGVRYFHDDDGLADPFVEGPSALVPAALLREIGFFLLPANRVWDRVVSFSSELFRRVVASGGGPPGAAIVSERERLRAPPAPLEADANLRPLVEAINAEMAGFFHSAPHLQLRVTSTDSAGVMEAVVPHYQHTDTAISLPARRHGSGLTSLQSLLLLLQLGRQRAALGENFWMALEEPELHIPPALQRRLVERIQALTTQTIVTTHSPLVAALSRPDALRFVTNEGGTLSVKGVPAAAAAPEAPNAVRRLFQHFRHETITALMYGAVLVPEGRTDVEWLRLLLRSVEVRQPWDPTRTGRFAANVGVAPTQDAAVVSTFALLSQIHANVAVLVDGDPDGQMYLARLQGLPQPPQVVMRWPDDWTFEDAIGWIGSADAAGAVRELAQALDPAPADLATLVARLKTSDRQRSGLKQDLVAYEYVCEALAANDGCRARMVELLEGVCATLLREPHPRFAPAPNHAGVFIFQP